MELYLLIVGVLVAAWYLKFFLGDVDTTKRPILRAIKKTSEGITETATESANAIVNTVEGAAYNLKYRRGDKLSGTYKFPVTLQDNTQYEVTIVYRGGFNTFDLSLITAMGSADDVWNALTDSQVSQVNSGIRDWIREHRAAAGLDNRA